jgi:hypothetical protein
MNNNRKALLFTIMSVLKCLKLQAGANVKEKYQSVDSNSNSLHSTERLHISMQVLNASSNQSQ